MSTTTRLSGRRLPILMYHSISDTRPDPNQICVSPKRFAEQLAWLHHHGYRGVSMVKFLDADAHGRGERLVNDQHSPGSQHGFERQCCNRVLRRSRGGRRECEN